MIEPAVLEDHRTTRSYLMQACLSARQHLGLETPAVASLVPKLELGNEAGESV
jgi:hypothetical protein